MKITQQFIESNLPDILEKLRPDLVFEYFSKNNQDWINDNTWNIKITNKELLGEYQNGKLVSGKWHNDELIEKNMLELYENMKKRANELKIPFRLFLNKLLCQGKQNDGISWNEYDYLLWVEKQNTLQTEGKA